MKQVEELPTEQLLQLALELSRADPGGETDERWDAIVALHKRPEELVALTAQTWCGGANVVERTLGADILGQLGFACEFPFRVSSLPVLEKLLADPEDRAIESALVALHHLGAERSLNLITSLTSHSSGRVRYGVAFALLGQSDPRAVRALIALSSDMDSDVRDWATFGIGSQIDEDSSEVRDALLLRLTDPDPDTRAEALCGLVRRRDGRVLQHLQSALRSSSVGTLEVQAALDLAEPSLLPELEALAAWWDVDGALLQRAIARCRTGTRSPTQV